MWLELKQIHKGHWYWYRRWRADGHVRSRYVGRPRASQARGIAMAVSQSPDLAADPGIAMAVSQSPDLAADPGIAMAVNGHGQARGIAMAADPVDDLAAHVDDQIDFNFTGPDTITIINVAPGATNITTNGVPAGNAASRRVDASSKMMVDRPAIKPEEP